MNVVKRMWSNIVEALSDDYAPLGWLTLTVTALILMAISMAAWRDMIPVGTATWVTFSVSAGGILLATELNDRDKRGRE